MEETAACDCPARLCVDELCHIAPRVNRTVSLCHSEMNFVFFSLSLFFFFFFFFCFFFLVVQLSLALLYDSVAWLFSCASPGSLSL